MKKSRQLINPDTWVLLKHIGVGLMIISLVGLMLAGVWHGTRVSSLTITNIDVEGGFTISHSEVIDRVNNELDGTYVGLVPKRFVWFFPEESVLTTLHEVDRLHNVEITKKSGTDILVNFDEYLPDALWCNAVDDESCLFLDSRGYAFGEAPNLTGGSLLRFITLSKESKQSEFVTNEENFSRLKNLTSLLAEYGWHVSHVELDQAGDAFLQIVDGGELKVAISDSSEKIVQNLVTILGSEEFSHIKPGNFQYIDLRFDNKVFVNEELVVETVIDNGTITKEEIME